MDLTVFDQLIEVDQYNRLDFIHQHLSEIQDQHTVYIVKIAQESLDVGDLKTASELSDLAVLCAIALDNPVTLAKATTVRAQVLFALGDNRSAIHYSLQAFNSLRRVYQHVSDIRSYFVEQDFEFGVALYDQKVASSLKSNECINMLNRVETIYRQCNYELGLGIVYWIKGDTYKDTYRLEDAFTSYMNAVKILRQYDMYITEILLNLSFVCGELNQVNEAKYYLDEAYMLFLEENNELGLASINISRAAFLRRTSNYRKLVRLYRQAYEFYMKHNQIEKAAFVKINVATLLMYYPLHQDQSIAFLKSAIDTFDEIGNKRLLAKAHGYLAAIYYVRNNYIQAKDLLLSIVDGAQIDTPIDTRWQSFYYLGSIELSAGNLENSYEYYQKALEVIENIRQYLRTEELIIEFLNLKPNFFGPLVYLANKLRKPIAGLAWIEKAKSRAFLHILGNSKLLHHSDTDSEFIEQLYELDKQLAILDRVIDSSETIETPETLKNWRQIKSEKIARYEQVSRQLKIRNAEMISIANVQPIGWDEIKDVLSISYDR